jgi:hypothetical protein
MPNSTRFPLPSGTHIFRVQIPIFQAPPEKVKLWLHIFFAPVLRFQDCEGQKLLEEIDFLEIGYLGSMAVPRRVANLRPSHKNYCIFHQKLFNFFSRTGRQMWRQAIF